jgi:hypothetical protein
MDNRAIEIRALIIAEIAGTLSGDEQLELHQLIEEHPEVRALADHLRESLNYERSISIDAMKEEFKQTIRTDDERRKLHKKKKLRILTALSSAAMAALWFFTVHPFRSPDMRPYEKSAIRNPKQITMAFNGQRHPLPGEQLTMHGSGRGTTDDNRHTGFTIPPALNAPISIKVPAGRTYNLKLEDGSSIAMNSESEVLFPASFGKTREITVHGEAMVKVANDPQRPFIVVMNNMRVQVLGTVFNVNTYNPERPEVALYSGSVKLTGGNKDVVLKEGKKATFNGQDFQLGNFDRGGCAWSRDTIILSDADEKEIVQAFARYFDQQIVFDKAFIGTARLTFNRHQPVSTLLEQLPGRYETYTQGNAIHLKRLN